MNGVSGRVLFLVLVSVLFFSTGRAYAEIKIGVLAFSEEMRYRDALRGIKDELAKAGYKEPKVTFVAGNAGGNKAKAIDLVRRFTADNVSLMITLGTNATIAAAREMKGVPIVFCMVYDPIEAGVARDRKSSGNNVTGTSTWIPMAELVTRLKEVKPVKRLGVLYTPGEKNSESQLKELQGVQDQFGIKVLPVIVTKKEDVSHILPEVMNSVDAVFLSGSSVIGLNVPQIVELANRSKVITVTILEDLVKQGVMLGVGGDPYLFGVQSGKKAVAVLNGARPSSIPIESPLRIGVILNKKSLREAQIKIPASVEQKATKIFD